MTPVTPAPRRNHRGPLSVIAIAAVLAAAAGRWLLWPAPSAMTPATLPTTTAPVAADAPVPSGESGHPVAVASEQQIRDHAPTALTVFRFADNPRILVLNFPSLHDQGRMLNRVAAFAEKVGLPRDRVLTDGQLDQAIRAQGDTIETFYYGHDYGADTLIRFFAVADRD
jgi:hypothetical protein